MELRQDRIAAVRHPEKVGCRPDRMAAVRHPDKVERWPDPDVRCPGGMNENFLSGWNERCHVLQGRESHAAIFKEDPTGMHIDQVIFSNFQEKYEKIKIKYIYIFK